MFFSLFVRAFLILVILVPAIGSTALGNSRLEIEADVVEWAGSGDHVVFVVVDFDRSTTVSAEFVFGVQFTSETITGEEALHILNADTGLEIHGTQWSFGYAVDEMVYSYAGVEYRAGYDPAWASWWSYWPSGNFGATWEYSMLGASDRVLRDGDTDGWLFADGSTGPNGPRMAPSSHAISREVMEWGGTGEREAFVVVDFDASTTSSAEFVFGVRFTSPTITGEEALHILNAETALTVNGTQWSFGYAVDEMVYSYAGVEYRAGYDPAWANWWSYWPSGNFGATWEYSMLGASDRVLHHGDTDGWLFADGSTGPNGPRVIPPSQFPPMDLNGDGRSDSIVRNAVTGDVEFRLTGETPHSQTVSYRSNWGAADSSRYDLLGSGDLNGDGRSDLILRYNPGGTIYICLMNETGSSWRVSYYSRGWCDDYSLLGVGDLNGDGRDDLILRYEKTKTVYFCLMNDEGDEKPWTVATYSRGMGLNYSLLGVGDLNGDGRDDLVLRYDKSGTVYYCLMREGGAGWDVSAYESPGK